MQAVLRTCLNISENPRKDKQYQHHVNLSRRQFLMKVQANQKEYIEVA